MNILFVEDNPRPADLQDLLANEHTVTYCSNLCDAEEYIMDGGSNGKKFDVLILDLQMNPSDLPKENRQEAIACRLAGFVFHKYIVKQYDENLFVHTIFYTAYSNRLQQYVSAQKDEGKISTDEYNELKILDKNSPNLLKAVNDLLKKLT